MRPSELSQAIKTAAEQAGFDACGIAPAVRPGGLDRFFQWLEAGYHGDMEWMPRRKDLYADPSSILDGARSVVMLALTYRTAAPAAVQPGQGRISRYAWGDGDYHDLIHMRLETMQEILREREPDMKTRGIVDTAPLLEREFAVLAGLGWQGKNTLLLNKRLGSWFFLAALLIDREAGYDARHETAHCGTCRACLDACPTGALVEPNLLDARRCISYLTIELKKPVPRELREGMGDWLFGCDICQDVCPWNDKSPLSLVPAFVPVESSNPVSLAELFYLDDDEFRRRFRRTPLWRPRRRGILRNAAIVLGNQMDSRAIPALELGLHDTEPLVRGACAWALGRCGAGRERLLQRLEIESDSGVREEIGWALATDGN